MVPRESDRKKADALNTASQALWEAHEALELAICQFGAIGYRGTNALLIRAQKDVAAAAEMAEYDADQIVG
jgi:hypothetical protein